MSKTIRALIGALSLTLIFAATSSAAYDPTGPVPEAKKAPAAESYSQATVDAEVEATQRSIYSPAPYLLGKTRPPTECNYVRFTRYRSTTGPISASNADAALLMVPGILEGANAFDYIARNAIFQAKHFRGANIEIWAMDRRPNCLEDLYGAQKAETKTNVADALKTAVDYYYNGITMEGHKFKGFLKSNDAPYLSEWGLKLDTQDMFKIMTTMVPSRATRKQKVYVGGHSLGGIHTSVFASWDFDGNPLTTADAGWNNTAGLFAFDSIVKPTSQALDGIVKSLGIPPQALGLADPLLYGGYEGALTAMRTGVLSNIFPLPEIPGGLGADIPVVGTLLGGTGSIDPETLALTEAIAYAADIDPHRELVELPDIPYGTNVAKTLAQLHTRDQATFDAGTPNIKDFRYTSAGLFGALFDDSESPIGFIQTSLGAPTGGPVVGKTFPSATGQFIPADAGPDLGHLRQGPLYDWANFDEIGNAGDTEFRSTDNSVKYTDTSNEMVDMHDFAHAMHIGKSNFTEWYFNIRPIVDIIAASRDWAPLVGINTIWKNKVAELPAQEFIGEQGVLSGGGLLSGLQRPNAIMLQGQNHLDPMFEVANKPSAHTNETIPGLLNLVLP
ncbi:MAG: hypothetical protein JHC87_00245 [Thermoleophilaceae bacterium]|nr:hypothetical protein [Thermoleophilaceae bacterium]